MLGPETRNPALSTLESTWRTEPGNGSGFPFRPNGSVYQPFGPLRLLLRSEVMARWRITPWNADRGSRYAPPAVAPLRIDSWHAPPRARAAGRKQRSTGRPTSDGWAGS